MRIDYRRSFEKDLKQLRGNSILKRISKVLRELESVSTLSEYSGDLTKMVGEDSYYRIRIGDFRIGFRLMGDAIELMHVRHRSNIYRIFP